MAIAMSVLGLGAALAGRVTASGGSLLRYAVAIVPLVMGMQVLGWVHLPLPTFSKENSRLKVASAFGCGFLLSLVIAPCGTPVLASVLSYAAFKGNAYYGALLLFVYGLGAGIPLLAAASVSSRFAKRLDLRGYRLWVDRATGALLLGLGFYLLWVA
jgi:cytochrome c biogenesis protein CcdA